MNTWPKGKRMALSQSEHKAWNANNYPGTRELCCECDEPTGRCEEDNTTDEDGKPYCESCAILAGLYKVDT